jgi:DNA-binding NarL/FixJ family response regulator
MDIRMPNLDGVEATKRVVLASPRTRVMMLTTFGEDGYVWQAMKAGASAFLLKDVPPEELAAAVRTVARGAACSARRSPAGWSKTSSAGPSRARFRRSSAS